MSEPSDYHEPTRSERDRIERFIAAYNAIKDELARITGKPEKASLNELVAEFGRKRRRWLARDGTELLALGEVRNLLVHERTEAYEYLFLPTTLALERIEDIRTRLAQPLRIMAGLAKPAVVCVSPDDTIAQVLRLVAVHAYSQYPVYKDDAFYGILTSNAVTRWLAAHLNGNQEIICPADSRVQDVLDAEKVIQMAFIDGSETVEEVLERFTENLTLLCLIVTTNGTQAGRPLQIVTRYDVAGLLGRLLGED